MAAGIQSKFNLMLAIACLILITSTSSPARCENPDKDSSNESNFKQETEKTAQQNNNMEQPNVLIQPLLSFTSSLFNKLRQDERNLILSPISIHAALSMLTLGAEPNSITDKELRGALGYPDGITVEQMDHYHKAYKTIIDKFQEISKIGLEVLKKADSQDESPEVSDKPPVIDFFNTVIAKQTKPLVKQYSNKTQELYNSTIQQIDPGRPETIGQVVDKINKWGKDAGFEQSILNGQEFLGDFAAMLVSAVRVQAFWFEDFYENNHKEMFHNFGLKTKPVEGKRLCKSDSKGQLVEFLSEEKASFRGHYAKVKTGVGSDFDDLAKLDFRAVKIPLEGDVSFTIFEPNVTGRGNELRELTERLMASNSSRLNKALDIIDQSACHVHFDYFCMPKYGFENDIDLVEPLRALGIKKMFDKFSSQLNGIIQNEPVAVDKAKHQAMIEVNKHGIKAAGVTKIRLVPLMAVLRKERIDVEIENPFMFVIRYQKIPLFVGQLVKLEN